MNLKRASASLVVSAFVAAASLAVLPATSAFASSHSLWVSPAPVSARGHSCSSPGFNTIQAAINAAPSGGTIHVCAGTYVEQLAITQPVSIASSGPGTVTVQLPATPANSTTACDTAPGTGSFQPDQDGVSICTSGTVKITGLTIDAAWSNATCDDSLYGILVAGGATLDFNKSHITAAGAVPLNGCQGGIGIQDGMAWTTPVEVGHAKITNSSISGYQKNGITVDGQNSTATILKTTVTGIGETAQIAQNGIQVSNGAVATITRDTVTGNECDVSVCGPNGLTQTQSTGLLFFGASPGSKVTKSKLNSNDIGIYYSSANPGSAPSSSEVSFVGNTLNDRYEGFVLDQGFSTQSKNTMSGGEVGIEIIQYNGQSCGIQGSATHDTISNITVAAVDVMSDQAGSGDLPGSYSISNSKISVGNAAKVLNNSSNITVTQSHNS